MEICNSIQVYNLTNEDVCMARHLHGEGSSLDGASNPIDWGDSAEKGGVCLEVEPMTQGVVDMVMEQGSPILTSLWLV